MTEHKACKGIGLLHGFVNPLKLEGTMASMETQLVLAGKAKHVFRYLALLARYAGGTDVLKRGGRSLMHAQLTLIPGNPPVTLYQSPDSDETGSEAG